MTPGPGRAVVPRLVVGLLVLTLLAAYVGWRLWLRQVTVPPDSALAEQCREVPEGAERITIRGADGRALGGAIVGPKAAAVAVVLRHGASQTICDWLPWAARAAQTSGVRILLFDRRGSGSSPGAPGLTAEPGDTVAAVEWLRSQGAERVALMGSSMGNSVTFTALPRLDPAACALIAVSPVLTAADATGALDGTTTTRLPDNLWVTWETGNAAVNDTARGVTERVPSPHTLPVVTQDHSIDLVSGHAQVSDFLTEAVGSCAA